ncbi:unnamed protein product [Ilex paraguariensis]|uniref:Uncharacterized protein n=1 Tax=Ilex paraguariensis TaxID=185542 RepID=A0ABC8TZH3_9AQUA
MNRKSITRRPSESRPVDLPKKVRPLGRLTGKPSPATSPPVSELESPKLNITGDFVHRQRTVSGRERKTKRRVSVKKWVGVERRESEVSEAIGIRH